MCPAHDWVWKENDENMKGSMSPRRQQWLTPHPHQPNIQPYIHWDWARDWPLSYLTAANRSRSYTSQKSQNTLNGRLNMASGLLNFKTIYKSVSLPPETVGFSIKISREQERRKKKNEVVSSRGNRDSAPTERSKVMWLNGKSNYWAANSTPSLSTDQEKMMIITMLRISRAPAVLKLWLPINQQTWWGGGLLLSLAPPQTVWTHQETWIWIRPVAFNALTTTDLKRVQNHQAKMFIVCILCNKWQNRQTSCFVIYSFNLEWQSSLLFWVFGLTGINHKAIWFCVDICRAYFLEHNLSFENMMRYLSIWMENIEHFILTVNKIRILHWTSVIKKKHRSCAMHVLRDKGCFLSFTTLLLCQAICCVKTNHKRNILSTQVLKNIILHNTTYLQKTYHQSYLESLTD